MKFLHPWFQKLEKFLATDLRYLLKGGFFLSFSRVFSSLTSLASSIAFANLVSPAVYGFFRYILTLSGVFSIATLKGVDTSLTRSIAQGKEGGVFPTLKVKIRYGIFGTLSALAGSIYYYLQGDHQLSFLLLILAPFVIILDPLYIFTAILNGKKLFALSVKYNSLDRIIATALIVGTLFLTDNIFVIVGVYFLANSIAYLICFLLTLRQVNYQTGEPDPESLTYGKHLSFMNALGQLSTYLDKLLIFTFVGSAPLALYYLSLSIFKNIQNILGSLNVLALPKFSNAQKEDIQKSLPKKVLKMYLAIIPIITVYFFAAPTIFRLVFPQYSPHLSQIMVLLLLTTPITLFSTALTAQREQKKLYQNSISYAVIRILALVILVPLFGVNGAVLAVFISNVSSALTTMYLFYKK